MNPVLENDPDAYHTAAERVTTDGDDVWVVSVSTGKDWRVSAVFGSYESAEAYINDHRNFVENCPEDANEEYARQTAKYRLSGVNSPKDYYDSWPPDE